MTSVDFQGDAGADAFTLSGDVTGSIDFSGGADADTLTLSAGSSVGTIDFEGDSGADVFIMLGSVGTDIDFGGGADADTLQIDRQAYEHILGNQCAGATITIAQLEANGSCE